MVEEEIVKEVRELMIAIKDLYKAALYLDNSASETGIPGYLCAPYGNWLALTEALEALDGKIDL